MFAEAEFSQAQARAQTFYEQREDNTQSLADILQDDFLLEKDKQKTNVHGYRLQGHTHTDAVTDVDFSHCDIWNYQFNGVVFSSATILVIEGVDFYSVDFTDCRFSKYRFKNCRFDQVTFNNTTLFQSKVFFPAAVFQNCILTRCSFKGLRDFPVNIFYNCYIFECLLPDIPARESVLIDYRSGNMNDSLSAIYKNLSEGFAASDQKLEAIHYDYLSKKYHLQNKHYPVDLPVNDHATVLNSFKYRLMVMTKVLIHGKLFDFVYYYIMGFGFRPLRVLLWWFIVLIVATCMQKAGFHTALGDVSSWGNSIKLELAANFSYGPAFVDAVVLNNVSLWQLIVFYTTSLTSLLLNGLFITTLFNFLTYEP